MLTVASRGRSTLWSRRHCAHVRARMSARPAAASCALADAHCHLQDDVQNLYRVPSLSASHLAVMGTRASDWSAVEQLYLANPDKVIPCFGVHPWFAHEHALAPGTTGREVLQVPERQAFSPQVQALLESRPSCEWVERLRGLLLRYPSALVGEFGLDRAAVLPGTKVQVSYSHQLQLTEHHLRLAAELRRPVSMHCVRAYGHLHDMLRRLGPQACPPRIMLHSFGGSVETVAQFTKGLPAGLGSRVYFSFSTVINGKDRDKLLSRIRAVPDDRLLLESDQSSALAIDESLQAILHIVAEAKAWPLDQAVQQAMDNFSAFFALEGTL